MRNKQTFAKLSADGKTVLKYPASRDDITQEFPNTIFPPQLTNSLLSQFGYVCVEDSEKPRGKPGFKVQVASQPKFSAKTNTWTQKWEVVPLTKEEIDYFWTKIRETRKFNLRACDWTQLPDVSEEVKKKWAPYRKLLRDIPQTYKNPWDVKWPQNPDGE